MERAIIGYHKDEAGDWVAELECGHTQHVRHNPPWQLRPWVITKEGRKEHIGHRLKCKKCDRNEPKDFEVSSCHEWLVPLLKQGSFISCVLYCLHWELRSNLSGLID